MVYKGPTNLKSTIRLASPLPAAKPYLASAPGKELVLDPLGLSVTEAANHLGMSRKTRSKVLNGRGTVTPEMALRLEMTFGKPDAAYWLRLQNAYDLWQARQYSRMIYVLPIAAHAV